MRLIEDILNKNDGDLLPSSISFP